MEIIPHAAAVPRAMATATNNTCTIRLMPEFVSPKMISRIALVKRRPGTRIIKVPTIAGVAFIVGIEPPIKKAKAAIAKEETVVVKKWLICHLSVK